MSELKPCTYYESVAIIKDVGAFPPKEALARNDPYLCSEIKRLREKLNTRPSPQEGSALECMLMSEDTLAKDWDKSPKAMIAEATIREIAPFLRRLINPRYDTDETNDYVNGSSDCIRALEAIQVWDEVCKQDKPKGGSDET